MHLTRGMRRVVSALLVALVSAGVGDYSRAAAPPAVNDATVQDVRIQGNRSIPTAELREAITLKAGGLLTRAIVLEDVRRIEALYQRIGRHVAVDTDLTHPGEHEGRPVTTLTYSVVEHPGPGQADVNGDPLEAYYDNTLVCAAAKTGNDLCHLWLYRDGSFINFDAGGAKRGHYSVGPIRADGKVPVCQYWDTPAVVGPAELQPSMGAPPAAAAARRVLICRTSNYRTTCQRVDPDVLTAQERKDADLTMGERFYRGMCYPIGPHAVGDIWFEADDPLPGQLAMDKMLLLPGRQ